MGFYDQFSDSFRFLDLKSVVSYEDLFLCLCGQFGGCFPLCWNCISNNQDVYLYTINRHKWTMIVPSTAWSYVHHIFSAPDELKRWQNLLIHFYSHKYICLEMKIHALNAIYPVTPYPPLPSGSVSLTRISWTSIGIMAYGVIIDPSLTSTPVQRNHRWIKTMDE